MSKLPDYHRMAWEEAALLLNDKIKIYNVCITDANLIWERYFIFLSMY